MFALMEGRCHVRDMKVLVAFVSQILGGRGYSAKNLRNEFYGMKCLFIVVVKKKCLNTYLVEWLAGEFGVF